MMRFLFIAVVGLLPFWLGVAYVDSQGSFDSLLVPWLAIFVIPGCGVTLVLVLVTLAVYSGVEGDQSRKLRISSSVFLSGFAAVGIATFLFWHKLVTQENDLKREARMAAVFVAEDQAVRLVVGDAPRVILSRTLSRQEPSPITYYDFAVEGSKTVAAVVAVDRSEGGAARFKLACITSLSSGKREGFDDVCAQ